MIDLEDLRKLAAKPALESWEGEVADQHLARCRVILNEAAQALLQLATQGDAYEGNAEQLAAPIVQAVEQLNIADSEGEQHFIYTIEREDLCEHLAQLGLAVGLTHKQLDVALSDRDW